MQLAKKFGFCKTAIFGSQLILQNRTVERGSGVNERLLTEPNRKTETTVNFVKPKLEVQRYGTKKNTVDCWSSYRVGRWIVNEKNRPQTTEVLFFGNRIVETWVFGFWILRSVQFGFRRPISDIFVRFHTPIIFYDFLLQFKLLRADTVIRKFCSWLCCYS